MNQETITFLGCELVGELASYKTKENLPVVWVRNKEIAKALRSLAKLFKIKLKACRLSASGSYIEVKYAVGSDSIAIAKLKACAERFVGIDFDGMTDSESFREVLLSDDGTKALRSYCRGVWIEQEYIPQSKAV